MRTTITTDPLPGSKIFFNSKRNHLFKKLPFVLCVGDFYCDLNYFIHRNRYDSYLILLVEKGTGFVKYEGVYKTLKQGDVVFLNCYKEHQYGATGEWHIKWMHIDGFSIEEYYNLYLQKHGFLTHFPSAIFKNLNKEIDHIIHFYEEGGQLSEIWAAKYITDLLTCLTEFNQIEENDSALLSSRVMQYLNGNFQRDLSISSVASLISVNPSYLIRQFKKETGITPYQYLMTIRLEYALYELKTKENSIKEVAFRSGFKSENSFCIAFKKRMHMTALEYRNEV